MLNNMAEQKEKIIFMREWTWASVLQDIFTYGITVGAFWFNYTFIGGNNAVDAILLFTFFSMGLRHLKEFNQFYEKAKKAK